MKFKAFGNYIIAKRIADDPATIGGVFDVVEAAPYIINDRDALVTGTRFVAFIATPLPVADLFSVHVDHVHALVVAEAP